MKGELLILFVILLLGLILCSFLGGKGYMEGFTSGDNTMTFMAPDGSKALVTVGDNITSKAVVTHPDGTTMKYTQTNTQQTPVGHSILYSDSTGGGSAILATTNSGISTFSTKNADGSNTITYTSATNSTDTTTTGSTTTGSTTTYDNYDHYSGTAYPTIFYGPNGGTARIVQTANNGTLVITGSNGTTQIYYINKNPNDPNVVSYYGPNGGSAKIVTDQNGKKAVEVTTPDGTKVLYYADNIYVQNSQDATINEYNPNNVTTGSDYNSAFNSTSYYGPNGGQLNTVTGPAGNTYASYDTSAYYNSLPQGIPGHMIPPGQEDLYILKSQVVPPVCPACPEPIMQCPNNVDVTKCPPCPPCARCPEPAFDCKKVPNYNAFNPDLMPVPVLNDFSSFGM